MQGVVLRSRAANHPVGPGDAAIGEPPLPPPFQILPASTGLDPAGHPDRAATERA